MSTYAEYPARRGIHTAEQIDPKKILSSQRYTGLLHTLDLAPLAPADEARRPEQQDIIFDCMQMTAYTLAEEEMELILATSGFEKLPVQTDAQILSALPGHFTAQTEEDIYHIRLAALGKLKRVPIFERQIPYANALSTHSIGYQLGLTFEGECYFIPPFANDILSPNLQHLYRDFMQGAGLTSEPSASLLKYPFAPEHLVSPDHVEQICNTIPYFTYLKKAEEEGLSGFNKWTKAHLVSVLHEARQDGATDIARMQYWLETHPDRFHPEVLGDLNNMSWQSRSIIQEAASMLIPEID